jgi:hypothetical protein
MKTIEELSSENEKLKRIIQHIFVERSGTYFICGETGNKDTNGLPDRILVCPTHGADWFQVYTKSNETRVQEW